MEIEMLQATPVGILQSILDELRKQNSRTHDIWDVGDIAEYLRLSKSSVHTRILGKGGFPDSIIFPGGGRRWLSREVKTWAEKCR